MWVARSNSIRSYFGTCLGARAECSGKQMRNGFLMLNLIAWAIILAGVEFLT